MPKEEREEGNEDPIGWEPLKSGECDRKVATAASKIKAASDNIAAAESAYHTRRSQSSN